MLELVCARVLLPAAARDESSMLARLDRLERRLEVEGAPLTAPRPALAPVLAAPAPEQPAPPVQTPAVRAEPAKPAAPAWPTTATLGPAVPEVVESEPTTDPSATPMSAVEAVAGGHLDAAAVRRLWPEVLEAIKTRRKMTTHALLSVYAQVVAVQGRTITLSFSTEPIRRQYHTGTNEDVLCEALSQVLGIDCRIETVAGGAVERRDESASAGAGPAAGATGVTSPPSATYETFAPGDEADDESDEPTEQGPRLDPEQAAVALLADSLGAKVIGQIDAG
jgi:DNA polymerase-3 subunit gamma/tau